MNVRPSAQIIHLPTAAAEPVRQHPRRGHYPAMVTWIRRGYLLKLEARTKAEKDTRTEWEQGFAQGQYLAFLLVDLQRDGQEPRT